MNSRSASIVGDREAGGSSSFAWCNRQWLWSQALTWRSSTRLKLTVFDHNLLWLPESNGYPHHTKWPGVGGVLTRNSRAVLNLRPQETKLQCLPMNCPGCATEMTAMTLQGRLSGQVAIDVCARCQAFW